MSDGVGDSGTRDTQHTTKNKSKKDNFAHSIARLAVAQVCESAGFQSFNQSALNTFSDVAVRYIREIGENSSYYANLAGRIECNVFDIIQGLEDLGSVQGFSGCSDTNRSVEQSGTIKEIARYVGEAEEIPFAYTIPGFPVSKERKPNPSFEQVGEMPPSDHIPTWLPVFPVPETCVNLTTGNERDVESQVEQIKKDRKMELSLLNLQQRLDSNGSEARVAVDPGDAAKAKIAADTNPFLAAPLKYGEKEVSSIVFPTKLWDKAVVQNHNRGVVGNHASVTIFPAIEAVKSGLCDSEEGRKKVILDRKPSVQFKFGTSRKFKGRAMSIRNEGAEKIASWFGNDSEKDDKKRRVEQILKEPMEGTDSVVN